MAKWNTKCRFFNEEHACETLTSEGYETCEECKFSSQYSKKILIIKFGALGDVLRTTSILEAIRKKFPDSLIYWLTLKESKELLESNPYIDKLLFYNLESVLRLQQEKFDILYSLEITPPATLLANIVTADEKFGFYFNNGATCCFNVGAEEYLETAFLTHKKLKNRKSYQELIFQTCELPYEKQEVIFELTEKNKKYAENFKKQNKISEQDKLLGINFGSSERWPSKSLSKEKVKEIIKKISDEYKIILLGGKNEEKKLNELKKELQKEGINILTNNPENSLREFASIIDLCDRIITTDSLALHFSIALKKPAIALFFSTPPWEIEDYNYLKKITSPLLEKYFFSKQKSEELTESITTEQILKALKSL